MQAVSVRIGRMHVEVNDVFVHVVFGVWIAAVRLVDGIVGEKV